MADIAIITKKCQWLRAYQTQQATASEREWFAALRLIKHTHSEQKTVEQIAHDFSCHHPLYDEESTKKRFEQITQRQPDPTPCSTFRTIRPDWCEGCAYAKWVNSPIMLEHIELPVTEAPIVREQVMREDGTIDYVNTCVYKPPDPYFRGKTGGIYVYSSLEGGESKKIYDYDIYPTRRLREEATGSETIELCVNLPHDGQKRIRLPTAYLNDQRKFVTTLADKGAFIRPNEVLGVQTYLIDYVKVLQREIPAQEEFTRIGWRDVDGENPRFVLGDYVISQDPQLKQSTLSMAIQHYKHVISAKGELDSWKEAITLYQTLPGELLTFTLLLAFAAPLLTFTPFHGMLYNIHGDPGIERTAPIQIMTSVWGKPTYQHIASQEVASTVYATINALQHVPLAYDEMATIASDALVDLAYKVTEGRHRYKDNHRHVVSQWKTLLCSTSTQSIYEKIGMAKQGNNAKFYRIFEVCSRRLTEEEKDKLVHALSVVSNHHGVAGRIYIAYVVKNIEYISDLIEQMSRDFMRHRLPDHGWVPFFVCLSLGGMIAKQLDLIQFDIGTSIEWGIQQMHGVNQPTPEVGIDYLQHLKKIIEIHSSNILHVDESNDPKNKVPDPIVIRVEYLKDIPFRLFIYNRYLKEFCETENVDYNDFIKKMREARILLDHARYKDMNPGKFSIRGLIRAWEIDVSQLPEEMRKMIVERANEVQ